MPTNRVKRVTKGTKRLFRTETPGERLRKERIFEFNALVGRIPEVEVITERQLDEADENADKTVEE